ncbi:hypothetical protein E3P91_03917 [Wallemia ichthyophaga]|nr:hypothetical protein E3P91_03917 [Wallemia ichthyophaga]
MNLFKEKDNKFESEVTNATSESHESEPYDLYFDLLDKLGQDAATNSKLIIAQIHKRLSHRHYNTQILSLKLVDFLLKNSESLHSDVASLSFTQSLQRLITDRNSDQRVKDTATDLVYNWSDVFDNSNDSTTLGLMRELADNLANQHIYPSNTHNNPPPSPDYDKLKEEEDQLQKVLEMSKTDIGGRFNTEDISANLPSTSQSNNIPPPSNLSPSPIPQTQNAPTQRVKALYDFEPQEPNELGFCNGDIITVLESIHKDWWRGELSGEIGIFPVNYVQILPNLTPSQITSEAQFEAELFDSAGDIDRLLRLLQGVDPSRGETIDDNEEIQDLYDKTLRLRPKIVKLIDKYSRKKDELVAINLRFNQARDLFAGMMERPGVGVYQQHQHQQPPNASPYQQPPSTSPYHQPPPQQYAPYPAHPQHAQTVQPAQPAQHPQQVQFQPGPYDEQWAQYYAAQAATNANSNPNVGVVSPNQNQFAAAAGVPQYTYSQTSPYAVTGAPAPAFSSPPPNPAQLSSTSLDQQFQHVTVNDQYGGAQGGAGAQQSYYPVQQ